MAFAVMCRCGQAFQVQPELAGKQVTCPVCGGVLVIPSAAGGEPKGIPVRCTCGRHFMANALLAGKAVQCPNCSAAIQVPTTGTSRQGSTPAAAPTFGSPGGLATDPFAGLDLGESRPNAPAPFTPSPNLPVSGYSVGSSASNARRSSVPKSGWRPAWIVLAIVGGGFALLCLACAGLIAVGVHEARKQANFGKEVAGFANSADNTRQSLVEARKGFVTQIVSTGESYGPPDDPSGTDFDLIRYVSPLGPMAAYVTRDPRDGRKLPAIVWITGGDNNSIGDVWSPNERDNDQSASAFRRAGIVMMFPSQRGGNDNPGRREGFYGEVDDILAATDHLARLPYVDSSQIYLGGHSTGGTMVMVVAACSARYKAVFALGPVAMASQYGGDYVYCDLGNTREIALRSPLPWLHCIKSPTYVFEGSLRGNWDAIQLMVDANANPQVHFFKVPGHDHFSVIAPLAEKLADQIIQGQINITQQTVQRL